MANESGVDQLLTILVLILIFFIIFTIKFYWEVIHFNIIFNFLKYLKILSLETLILI